MQDINLGDQDTSDERKPLRLSASSKKHELTRFELIQAHQKRILELMAIDAPLTDILVSVLRMIEAQSSSAMLGSILLADSDGLHLRLGAAPSLPHAYNQATDGTAIADGNGSCGTAAFLEKPVLVSDIASDPLWKNCRELAAAHGLGACWSTPFFSSSGKLLGTFAMYYPTAHIPQRNDLKLVDITIRTAAIAIERKHAHDALLESEECFRTIVNQTITGVMKTDATGRMTLVNQRWCEMLGYSEAELLQMSVLDVTHEDDRATTIENINRLAEGGPDYVVEKRYLRKDSTFFWASNSVNTLRNAAGEYMGLVAVALDITERKRAEEALQTSEKSSRNILESITEGFFALDENWQFTYINHAGEVIFDRTSSELVGKSIWEVYPEIIGTEFERHYRYVVEHHEEVTFTAYYPSHKRWYEVHVYPAKNGITIYFSNVTEKVEAQETMRLRLERFRLIADISARLVLRAADSNPESVDELLESVFFCVARHLNVELYYIYLANDDAQTLRLVSSSDMDSAQKAEIEQIAFGQLLCGHVALIRQPLILGELQSCSLEHAARLSELGAKIYAGYPLLVDGHLLGTISFATARRMCFTVEELELIQTVADLLAVAVQRERSSLAMHSSEQRYRKLFDSIDEGYATIEVLFDDDDKPIDYRYIETNPAFEKQAGLLNVVGKTIRELAPGIEKHWIETYAKVVRTRKPIRFEHYAGPLNRWFNCYSFCINDAQSAQVGILFSNVTDRKLAEDNLWQRANYDSLTGLPNRCLFRDRLEHEIKKTHRSGFSVALFFIDLDRFKEVNDLHGHAVGDLLLVETAQRISACVREFDTVARLGGDEFTAILTELDDVAHSKQIAQKIIDAIAKPFLFGREIVYLSTSIGVTFFPDDATNAEDMIRNADQAMYAAKYAGRNRYHYFKHSMQHEATDRLRLIEDLRNAIINGQFEVYYQPVLDLSSGRIAKAEALLRWHHPIQGLIDPAVFIPFAEDSGLINKIGDWVFTEAAAYSKVCAAQTGAPFQISVNKSPLQFRDSSKKLDWISYLAQQNLAASSISIEITEGLLLNTSEETRNKLMQFRNAGIEIAIDDFGTGYSSMAYLKEFEIDYLKIDQSFINDMHTDKANFAIVRSMIAMAHELEIKVVAEGIETAAQQTLLMNAGCDYGQGFLYSEALPPGEFIRRLQTDFRPLQKVS